MSILRRRAALGHDASDRTASSSGAASAVRRGAVATGAGLTLALAAAAPVAGAAYALRRLVTPERDRPDNVEIVATGEESVTFRCHEDTLAPGRYGVWLDGGSGHLRVGDILTVDVASGTVTRRLEGVDAGTARPGPARWNGYYHGGDPATSLGLPCEHVTIDGPVGALPAWFVPGAGRRCAVLVHGRGALRGECLRAMRVVHDLGWDCLVPAYRNDEDAPASGDRRYALGLAEWADVDAALAWARGRGAREFALMGWSMGGAIVLQTLARSPHADDVTHVVLDAPVVDWNDVIDHHVRLGRAPALIARLAPHVLRCRGARRLVGIESPLDVAETDWAGRAAELRHRTLLIHSLDDEFVPVGPSQALAAARRDMVTFAPWWGAAHCKEWNTDSERWERIVADFLRA